MLINIELLAQTCLNQVHGMARPRLLHFASVSPSICTHINSSVNVKWKKINVLCYLYKLQFPNSILIKMCLNSCKSCGKRIKNGVNSANALETAFIFRTWWYKSWIAKQRSIDMKWRKFHISLANGAFMWLDKRGQDVLLSEQWAKMLLPTEIKALSKLTKK